MWFLPVVLAWAQWATADIAVSSPIRILDRPDLGGYDGRPNYPEHHLQDPYRAAPSNGYVIYDDKVPPRGGDRPRVSVPMQHWHAQFHRQDFDPRPTMSYQATYSNTIKVFDDPAEYLDMQQYPKHYGYKWYYGDRPRPNPDRPLGWNYPQVPKYDVHYPYEQQRDTLLQPSEKIPENFPILFLPEMDFRSGNLHLPEPKPTPKMMYPNYGMYNTYTVNYGERNSEALPPSSRSGCNFIRLNSQGFPVGNDACARSDDDMPLLSPSYPDYSRLPNERIPLEHRVYYKKRESKKRRKRSTGVERHKRVAGYGYRYPPSTYGTAYYPDTFRNNNPEYDRPTYRGTGYSDDYRPQQYDDDYSSEESTGGLTSYLTSGGRRAASRGQSQADGSEDSEERHEMTSDRTGGNQRSNSTMLGENRDEGSRKRGYGSKRNNDEEEDSESEEEDDDRGRKNSRGRRRGNKRGSSSGGGRYREDSYEGNRGRGTSEDRVRGSSYGDDSIDSLLGGRNRGRGNRGDNYGGSRTREDSYGGSRTRDNSYGGSRYRGDSGDMYGGNRYDGGFSGFRSGSNMGSYGGRNYGSGRTYGSYGSGYGDGQEGRPFSSFG